MKNTTVEWSVHTRSGLAVGDEEGRFAGETPSEGNYVVRGEFGTLEEARLLIASAPEMLNMLKKLTQYEDSPVLPMDLNNEIVDLIYKAEGK